MLDEQEREDKKITNFRFFFRILEQAEECLNTEEAATKHFDEDVRSTDDLNNERIE